MIDSPAGLGDRGVALWAALTADRTWDAAGLTLVAEACRMADRLEKLDELLRHEASAWVQIVDNYRGTSRDVELNIDDALGEARQLQLSLMQMLKMLGLGKATAAPQTQEDPLDELVRQWASGSATPPAS